MPLCKVKLWIPFVLWKAIVRIDIQHRGGQCRLVQIYPICGMTATLFKLVQIRTFQVIQFFMCFNVFYPSNIKWYWHTLRSAKNTSLKNRISHMTSCLMLVNWNMVNLYRQQFVRNLSTKLPMRSTCLRFWTPLRWLVQSLYPLVNLHSYWTWPI